MQGYPNYGHIDDVLVVGHGSIGRTTVPLIKRHFTYNKITIIDPDPVHQPETDQKVQFLKIALTALNFKGIFDNIFVGKVGFCINLGVGTSSFDMTHYCQQRGILFLDTGKEEWEGHYSDLEKDLGSRTNYGMRERMLKEVRSRGLNTTAVSCCGANPGMVNWMVKQALLNIARDTGFTLEKVPETRREWGLLMMNLGIKGIQVSERDTQRSKESRKEGEFWNTWSVASLIDEGYHQPAELGWGTHQKWMPPNAVEHKEGHKSCIYLAQRGINVKVKCWCPIYGPQYGFLVTHDQSISMPDYYTVKEGDKVIYRPSTYYAYHPCQDCVISCLQIVGTGVVPDKSKWKVIEDDIVEGVDQVGVLLYGHAKNAYWYGSQLDFANASKRAPYQSATSLQVSSAVIAGMAWALEHPEEGLVECNQMDFKRCLQIQEPYIAPVKGHYTDWNPLMNQANNILGDQLDLDDPWQFKNILLDK